MSFAYRLRSTGHNSDRYGATAVCHQHVSEVFIQTEMRSFNHPVTGRMELTYHRTNPQRFGHKDCLIPRQRISE